MKRRPTIIALSALCVTLLGCGDRDGPRTPHPVTSSSAGTSGASGAAGSVGGAGAPSSEETGGTATHGGAAGSAGDAPASSGTSGQGGGDGGMGGDAPDSCPGAQQFGDVSVFSRGGWDPLGYPPYALDGCRLVYVAPDAANGGALHLRDLSSGDDRLLEAASALPRRPAIAGDVMAWEIEEGGKSRVRVSYRGAQKTLGTEFDHAGEPRVTTDAVVFTAFRGAAMSDDSDVYLYDVLEEALVPIATGPGQQRFADVSPTHVALSDFSEDPRGYFDEMASLSDVLLVERTSGTKISRSISGKQAFPLLGSDGRLVYLDWGEVHPEPKFSQFWLKAGRVSDPVELDRSLTVEQIHTDPAYVRPSLRGARVDFIDTRSALVGLYRADLDRQEAPAPAPISGASRLLGPVAADSLTLISTPSAGQSLSLVAIER